jgi:hypothetical protein
MLGVDAQNEYVRVFLKHNQVNSTLKIKFLRNFSPDMSDDPPYRLHTHHKDISNLN